MKLGQIMSQPVVSVDLDDTLETMRDLFETYRFHHLLVKKRGRLVGVISDRDLLKNISPFIGRPLMERSQDLNTLQRRAHQIMTRDLVVGDVEMPVEEAAYLLLEHNVTCLPIVDENNRLRGIVTWRDLLRHAHGIEPGPADAEDAADAA